MDVKELELPDNFTNWAEVEKSFQALGQPWQAFLMVIYSVTAIVSLCSNLLTIIILLRGEHLSTELWKFLLNLSVADILMAVFCIPVSDCPPSNLALFLSIYIF